jgi:hypothetical protein
MIDIEATQTRAPAADRGFGNQLISRSRAARRTHNAGSEAIRVGQAGGGGGDTFTRPGQQIGALLTVNSGLSEISSRDGGGGLGDALAEQLSRQTGLAYVPTYTAYPVTGQLVPG